MEQVQKEIIEFDLGDTIRNKIPLGRGRWSIVHIKKKGKVI